MKLVASYLEKAVDLEVVAADEPGPNQNETRGSANWNRPHKAKGAQNGPSLCAPFPSQGVPARGRVIIRNADNAITAALGRAAIVLHHTKPSS
jgi:hypothetical protein